MALKTMNGSKRKATSSVASPSTSADKEFRGAKSPRKSTKATTSDADRTFHCCRECGASFQHLPELHSHEADHDIVRLILAVRKNLGPIHDSGTSGAGQPPSGRPVSRASSIASSVATRPASSSSIRKGSSSGVNKPSTSGTRTARKPTPSTSHGSGGRNKSRADSEASSRSTSAVRGGGSRSGAAQTSAETSSSRRRPMPSAQAQLMEVDDDGSRASSSSGLKRSAPGPSRKADADSTDGALPKKRLRKPTSRFLDDEQAELGASKSRSASSRIASKAGQSGNEGGSTVSNEPKILGSGCPFCAVSFGKPWELVTHMTDTHGVDLQRIVKKVSTPRSDDINTYSKSGCPFCSELFAATPGCLRHILAAHRNSLFCSVTEPDAECLISLELRQPADPDAGRMVDQRFTVSVKVTKAKNKTKQ